MLLGVLVTGTPAINKPSCDLWQPPARQANHSPPLPGLKRPMSHWAASVRPTRWTGLPGVAPRDANDACSAAAPGRPGARAFKQLDLVEGLAGTLRHAGERGIREAGRDVGLLLDSLGQPA